ncbi:hypothetical protein [Atopobium fossor]|uniref:hypothetical protein n=1 Tax=Atopobium fossor TaxID=39487 RepID=UPI00040875C1|nr:hypothetical protein [Atopobium fossor]
MGFYFAESSHEKNNAFTRMLRGAAQGCVLAVVMLVVGVLLDYVMKGSFLHNNLIASIIVAGVAGGILQEFWFDYDTKILASLHYTLRILGFGLSYFVVLFGCAWFGMWLPVTNIAAWVTFVILYLLILAMHTIVINAAFKKQGGTYVEQLEEYRKHQDK